MENRRRTVLVHLAAGIGNIVFATPLLVALNEMEFVIDVSIYADYPQTADLLRDWSIIRAVQVGISRPNLTGDYDYVIPAIPPFYWPRFAGVYRSLARVVGRPLDACFYQDEQEYYLKFARALGYSSELKPLYRLPIAPSASFGVTGRTLAIVPGCKTGEMAFKRWPYFCELAERFEDVVIVGTADDLRRSDGTEIEFPSHVRLLTDRLTLRETAEALAAAGAVAGNDSGLSHVAAAVGTPVLMLFGPTPHLTLGQLPPNVRVLRANLACEPCWFGSRFHACESRIDCLRAISVEGVAEEVRKILGPLT